MRSLVRRLAFSYRPDDSRFTDEFCGNGKQYMAIASGSDKFVICIAVTLDMVVVVVYADNLLTREELKMSVRNYSRRNFAARCAIVLSGLGIAASSWAGHTAATQRGEVQNWITTANRPAKVSSPQ